MTETWFYKNLNDDPTLEPIPGTACSAGIDLKVKAPTSSITIEPLAKNVKVPTGISCIIPLNHMGLLALRSSAAKRLRLSNSVGIIDADYRGEICALVDNPHDEPLVLNHGERIVQLIILPIPSLRLARVDELPEVVLVKNGDGQSNTWAQHYSASLKDTPRGEGGFGSTGI